jgi:glycosyltransferase involved in cell wall biosynthesis
VLAIVGPDDEGLGRGLMRLAEALGVADRVVLTGMVNGPDRHAALAAADVWVLPSDTENFGNAVVEAMAAGVPSVITPGVNLAAEIDAAGAGLVCATEPAAIAAGIAAILDDPKLAEDLSAGGRSFAARYDWATVAPKLRAMYERALAGAGRS